MPLVLCFCRSVMLAGAPWAAIGSNSSWMLPTCLSVHRCLIFCLLSLWLYLFFLLWQLAWLQVDLLHTALFFPWLAYLTLQITLWIFHSTRVQSKACWTQQKSPADFNGTLNQILNHWCYRVHRRVEPFAQNTACLRRVSANYIFLDVFLHP